IPPRAVVLIESDADAAKILAFSRERRIPLTFRSGGTNLTGNAVGEGIVADCSRLRDLVEVNPEEGWARVQPGMVYADLNAALARHGLKFAPDPSSGEMCKLGGMLGNNSAGPRSLKYGAVKDNVRSLEVLLADGARLTAKPYRLGSPACEELFASVPAVRELAHLVRDHADAILAKRRAVSKNSSGYNLFALAEGLQRGLLDLPRLFIGSEGTLGLVTEATLRLVPLPRETATGLFFFERLAEVTQAVAALRPLGPSALELIDGHTLDLIGRSKFGIPDGAAAVLLVEFDAPSAADLLARADAACRGLAQAARPALAADPERQAALWGVRKAIYPTLYRFDAARHPVNFVDDVVVPAERLAELVAYLESIFAAEGVTVAIYGHIGDGNAHVNPLLNLRDPADFDRMDRLSRTIHAAVIDRFGGSLCGEHGDGRVRAEFLPALYGKEIYELFVETKRLFDPERLLNPGVKLATTPFTDRVDIERLAKPCATCGKCNTVCPAYDVAREESNGARGWYHALTASDFSHERDARVVDACLNCRSCAVVCPAGIDVSRHALARRAERPNPVAGVVARALLRPALFRAMTKFAAATQSLWDRPLPRRVLDAISRPVLHRLAPTARLPHDLRLPRLARTTLRERHHRLTDEAGATGATAYFHGCAAEYFDDGVGDAVIRLLERRGLGPVLPRQRCSGTPIQTYGQTGPLMGAARFNLDSLERFDTVVTGCASCTLMLRDYPTLFTGEDQRRAQALARKVRHITEILAVDSIAPSPAPPIAGSVSTVTYHSSCHLRAAGISKEPRRVLATLPGMQFVEMPDADRCAGGAGTFIVKNPELSDQIVARKRRAVEASGADVVATSCPACLIRLRAALPDRVRTAHVAQLADEAESAAAVVPGRSAP
ncbi:MAG TPA: FAD-binding and (Fe-S)-binding domain-containing protein, partial [Nitrospiria bacterium]|nr:FAD-binding and (Fe-S)-binding domain-containing protein [Nitrospiria bacterium]